MVGRFRRKKGQSPYLLKHNIGPRLDIELKYMEFVSNIEKVCFKSTYV